jgi:hypothetical protein
LISAASEDAYLHPDALWQGLEPASGAIWGRFEASWEFDSGARSWLWPWLLAVPMQLAKSLGVAGPGQGMGVAILGARSLVALIDVATLALLTRFILRHHGGVVAGGVGFLLAFHPAFVVMGAQPLIDTPAACALVLAWSCCERDGESCSPASSLRVGASLAFALMLRIQLGPALLVMGLAWMWRAHSRGALRSELPLGLAAGVAVVVVFGALDWLSWGSWWHSLRTYLAFNFSEQGQSFGSMPADRYWEHAELALPYLRGPLVGLAVLGSWRRPTWGLALLAFWLPHQLLEYRVWRFIHPGLFLLVACAAAGFDTLTRYLEGRGAGPKVRQLMVAAGFLVFTGSALRAGSSESLWRTTWAYEQGGAPAIEKMRGLNRAALWVSSQPDPGVTVNQVVPHAAAPGRALFGHLGPRLHLMSNPGQAGQAQAARMWILPAEAEAQVVSAGFRVVWKDPSDAVIVAEKTLP